MTSKLEFAINKLVTENLVLATDFINLALNCVLQTCEL